MKLTSVAILMFVISLLGCPPANQESKTGPCTKLGDNCEVAAGKLGTCVAIDTCAKPPCGFACQSQH